MTKIVILSSLLLWTMLLAWYTDVWTSPENTIQSYTILNLDKAISMLNASLLPNPMHSRITLQNNETVYNVGDTLVVTISLYDSNDVKVSTGGDVLMLLLREGKRGANVNGNIIDNDDGTYTGTVLLPWTGTPELIVYVSIPRQILNILDETKNEYGIIRHVAGIFLHGNDSETTRCGPLPKIRGYKETCNMTAKVYNVSWYCGKPTTPGLSCEDLQTSRTADKYEIPTNITRLMWNHLQQRLHQRHIITVGGANELMLTSRLPCDKLPWRSTWNVNMSGFYYNSTWTDMRCRYQLNQTRDQYTNCLAGRHLIIIGDSNSRSFLNFLKKFLHLTITRGNPLDHAPNRVYGQDRGRPISTAWIPHGLPYYQPKPYHISKVVPTSLTLDRLGVDRNNRSIVIIHLWTHFIAIPVHVLKTRIHDVRMAVERLLSAAPNITVVIKGPHSYMHKHIFYLSGEARTYFAQIWRDEFRYLTDKVIYLNCWDITAGSENPTLHPNDKTLADMVHMFMNYVCK